MASKPRINLIEKSTRTIKNKFFFFFRLKKKMSKIDNRKRDKFGRIARTSYEEIKKIVSEEKEYKLIGIEYKIKSSEG
jgi:hypothetical protein